VRKWDSERVLAIGKCIKLNAQIVGKMQKFLLSQKKADQYIAGNATRSIESFRFLGLCVD
jgi:hypothetical protein